MGALIPSSSIKGISGERTKADLAIFLLACITNLPSLAAISCSSDRFITTASLFTRVLPADLYCIIDFWVPRKLSTQRTMSWAQSPSFIMPRSIVAVLPQGKGGCVSPEDFVECIRNNAPLRWLYRGAYCQGLLW